MNAARTAGARASNTILHLIPTLDGGGAEHQLVMLATEQAKRYLNVHVAVRRGGPREQKLCAAGVSVHVLGDGRGPSPLLAARIAKLVWAVKPHIIQTWLPQMDVLGGLVALSTAIPWVLSERSSHLAFQGKEWWSWCRFQLGRRARAIVANSAGGIAYWRRSDASSPLLEIVSNAVDVHTIRNVTLLPAIASPGCDGYLLVVGRLGPEKCVATVVEALRLIFGEHGVQLLIVGDGPEKQRLEFQIGASGLTERVCLSPFRSDWWGLMTAAKGIISMSLYEGQPNVVLEAMAAACPLIVSDIPAHRELLDETVALFARRSDAASLADAIRALLSDEDAARQRAERASLRIDDRTVESMADAYDRVYQRIVRTRGAA